MDTLCSLMGVHACLEAPAGHPFVLAASEELQHAHLEFFAPVVLTLFRILHIFLYKPAHARTCQPQHRSVHAWSVGFGTGPSFSRDREEGREPRAFDAGPSRADTVDNWGASRQFVPSARDDRSAAGSFGPSRRTGGGGFDGAERFREREPLPSLEPSRADLEERWSRGTAAASTAFEDRPRRAAGAGSFADSWQRGRDGPGEGGERFRG